MRAARVQAGGTASLGQRPCPAAAAALRIEADGSLRACDYAADDGATPLADVDAALAGGCLPLPHCRRCATWIERGQAADSPAVREHAHLDPAATEARQVTVVVERDAARAIEALQARTTKPDRVIVEAPDAAAAADAIGAAGALTPRPHLTLRVADARPAAEGLHVDAVEVSLTQDDAEQIAALAALREATGAEQATVRFVLTPASWFDFETVAGRCAEHGATTDWRVLGRGGDVPIEVLDDEDLHLVAELVANTWQRLGSEERPASLDATDLDRLAHELRLLLECKVEEAAGAPTEQVALPPLDHPWHQDEQQSSWWRDALFAHANIRSVSEWTARVVTAMVEAGDAVPDWLRALAHRVSREQQPPELLQTMRRLYGEDGDPAALLAADRAFAETFDLTKFGGPWFEQLGLGAVAVRKPPFAVGPAVAPPDGATPDITVLIPSYRHEAYIEETLRSVLAQDYAAIRVLVADDRSPDDTVARARTVDDPRIDVRVNDTNLGLGNSVLAALEAIDTPYVALLNSDDLFHPSRLRRCREVLEQEPSTQLVTTAIDLIDQRGGEITPDNASLVIDGKKVHDWVQWFVGTVPDDDLPREQLFAALLERNFLVTSSNLVARTDWLRQQADSLRSLKYCLDWQLFLQAALEGALHHIHDPLVSYRLHATNTVWFREGRRWSYYLEVNRVAAGAVQSYLSHDPEGSDERLEHAVTAIANNLAVNTETDGLALFLHALVDPLRLEQASAEEGLVQQEVCRLNARSEPAADSRERDASGRVRSAVERNRVQGRQRRIEGLERRLLQAEIQALTQTERLHTLEREKTELYEDQARRIAAAAAAEDKVRELYADQEQRIAASGELQQKVEELYQDQKQRIEAAAKIQQQVQDLYKDQKQRIEAAERLQSQIRDLYADQKGRIAQAQKLEERLRGMDARRAELQQECEQGRAQIQALTAAQQELTAKAAGLHEQLSKISTELDARSAELETQTAQVDALSRAKEQLEQKRKELQHDLTEQRHANEALLASREYRAGNFIWNKLPLGYMSRRTKKWYRRILDAKDRAKMFFKRSKQPEGTAVVAACWQWPIYSHTFVYQEMISLGSMGLDVQLFHWDLGDTDQLHSAFEYLNQNRTQLQPDWEKHKQDKAHLEQAYPGKLRSFLERISPLVGKSAEELENEPIVMQACTFTRMAELAGARYLHSYFFYDQSFMAMLAAWVLDLPRGVSCYADHMMDDYQFKLVPLHVELADVIVATSARIKQELSQLSGGDWDDKIVVKPNGVDGERFPARTRPTRAAGEPFEVISVSRIEPKKGLTHLVEAIAELKKRGHTVIAHIIGSKDPNSAGSLEYSDMFEQCIKDNGVEDQVILHGMMKQEQMPPIIEKSRAFVAPYVETESGDKDGIPTAMLEALASSLPIITTNSGSITEVVDDGVEGFVVAQRDSMAFANALEKVITDTQLEQQLAANARARFDKDFDIRVTEKRLHERVRGFLAEKSKA